MSRFPNITNPLNWFKPKNPLSGVFVWSGTHNDQWDNILNWGVGGVRPIPGLPTDSGGLVSRNGLTMNYGSNAERLPGANDEVILFFGRLVGGTHAVKSLQIKDAILQIVTITATSTITGELADLEAANLTAGSNVTMDNVKLDEVSSITLSKPATITISGGIDYISEARLTAPGASRVLFKDFASNAGTVIAEEGTVVFERMQDDPTGGNKQASIINTKNCIFNHCPNAGIVNASGKVTFNGLFAKNSATGLVRFIADGAAAIFNDASNLGEIRGELTFEKSIATLSAWFRASGRYAGQMAGSIGNVAGGLILNVGNVEFGSGTLNNGNIRRDFVFSDSEAVKDLCKISFKGATNKGSADADIIEFSGNASNAGAPFPGSARSITRKNEGARGIFFRDSSSNSGTVLGIFEFTDNSSNAAAGKVWHFVGMASAPFQAYFSGNATNSGYVSTCIYVTEVDNLTANTIAPRPFRRFEIEARYKCATIKNGFTIDCCQQTGDFGATPGGNEIGQRLGRTLIFKDNSVNLASGNVEGCVEFEGLSLNAGTCLGRITFCENSSNARIADGDVKYIDDSTLTGEGKSDGRVVFHGNSENFGEVRSENYVGYVVFAGKAKNSGTVYGPKECNEVKEWYIMPTFYDSSKNTEDGKIESVPQGSEVLFYDHSENLGELECDVWFSGTYVKNKGKLGGGVLFTDGATNEGDIYSGYFDLKGQGGPNYINGFKVAPANVPAYPSNSRERVVTPMSFPTINSPSSLPDEFPTSGQCFFDGAKNKGKIQGIAIFGTGSSNQGEIDSAQRPYFFQAWSTANSESQAGIYAVESSIDGYVKGSTYFRYSTLKGTAEPNGTAHFKYSNNDGTVIGSALFEQSDNGEEYGGSALVTGNASFIGIGGSYENGDSSGATNYGYVQGDASFSAYAVNFGKVECLNYGDGAGFFGGQVGGNATFTEGSRNGLCGSNYSSLPVNCDGSQGGGLVRTVTWAGVDGNASFDGSSSWGADCSGVGGTTSCPTCNVPDFPDNPPPDNPLIP